MVPKIDYKSSLDQNLLMFEVVVCERTPAKN